jgi:glycosyltransferase involved in cell wall biosynthesis
MKILHAIDQLKMGGAQTHLLTILKEMQLQHPKDTHILLVLFDEPEFREELTALDIKVITLDLRQFFKRRKFYKAYLNVKQCLKSLGPDVVETHLTWSRLLINTAAFNLKIKRRLGFEHGDVYMNSFKMRVANYVSQFMFHEIIVCSDALKEWVNKTHYIKKSKLKVMYNCVDLKKFSPATTKSLDLYFKTQTPFPKYTFITVGTMGTGVNKRMDISIKAIARLRKSRIDVGLVICGDGVQRSELENLASSLNISDRLYFLGNRDDVEKILPHCYAYVHSAPYEPFGIVCIEALASGLPVVLPNSGGIQHIISDKKEGRIYKSLDDADLSEKMLAITKLDSEYSNYSKAAMKRVEAYAVTSYVKSLYKLYEK